MVSWHSLHFCVFFIIYSLLIQYQKYYPALSLPSSQIQIPLQLISFMLHKPSSRKAPKKYDNSDQEQQQVINKLASKPAMNIGSAKKINANHNQVRAKINSVEKKVGNISGNLNNAQLQLLLIGQIKDIKNELKEIKQQIGLSGHKKSEQPPIQGRQPPVQGRQPPMQGRKQPPAEERQQYEHEDEEEAVSEEEQNIYGMVNPPQNPQYEQQPKVEEKQMNMGSRNYMLVQHPKILVESGKIQPYMKQFKMEVNKQLLPIYWGYHKKSSKTVVIKYCPQTQSLEHLFNLYEKLWKNIVKAKQICINKVYDLHEPLASYILVLQANKMSLREVLASRTFKVSEILVSLIKALQFFHQCGYLYRNMHPEHVMCSYEHNIVVIDFKRVRRYVDMKGKHIFVGKDDKDLDDEFISNARVRGIKQGRKDDLQSLGYLALFILEGQLPWNVNNMAQIRSKLTLKQLCGQNRALLEYMIAISQMGTEDMPDYSALAAHLLQI